MERNGRSGEIRTHDPQHPMLMRYQAALRSDRGISGEAGYHIGPCTRCATRPLWRFKPPRAAPRAQRAGRGLQGARAGCLRGRPWCRAYSRARAPAAPLLPVRRVGALSLWAGSLTSGARRPGRARPGRSAARAARCRAVSEPMVDLMLQRVGGAEHEHAARADRHFRASLRVAADTLSFLPDREAAEGRDLDHLAAFERIAYFGNNRLDKLGGFIARQTDLLIDGLGQLSTGDCVPGH